MTGTGAPSERLRSERPRLPPADRTPDRFRRVRHDDLAHAPCGAPHLARATDPAPGAGRGGQRLANGDPVSDHAGLDLREPRGFIPSRDPAAPSRGAVRLDHCCPVAAAGRRQDRCDPRGLRSAHRYDGLDPGVAMRPANVLVPGLLLLAACIMGEAEVTSVDSVAAGPTYSCAT